MALWPTVDALLFFGFVYELDVLTAIVLGAARTRAYLARFQEVPKSQFGAFRFIEVTMECLSELPIDSVGLAGQLLHLVQIYSD